MREWSLENEVERFVSEARKRQDKKDKTNEEWRRQEKEKLIEEKPKKINGNELEEELKERKQKRLNIHIYYENGMYRRKEDVMEVMERRLKVRIEPMRVKFQKGRQIIIESANEKEKRDILGRRKIMKGTGVWVGKEKTSRELEVERWIRRKAKWEQSNGNVTEVEGKKIKIREVWWCWNKKKENWNYESGRMMRKRSEEWVQKETQRPRRERTKIKEESKKIEGK
ncbi:golgin subfamily A member 6-like protein 2 [Microplitis demolitor]|uniref:golgin subfamily A member 6-like protein 2 n=1 Tax=Microplitis demolitor TaxID=69319 RepID=UPI00235B6DD2|nr:golgin subfamily A member 6-like protein 2 [Microplitis demolitor]XP_053596272.1 golgin subfamily A member 6-like protein 2 [Microplitis demolitor]